MLHFLEVFIFIRSDVYILNIVWKQNRNLKNTPEHKLIVLFYSMLKEKQLLKSVCLYMKHYFNNFVLFIGC